MPRATSTAIDLIRRGKRVRENIRQIAENGDTSVRVHDLEGDRRVDTFHVGTAPLVPQGRVGATSFPNATIFTLTGDHYPQCLATLCRPRTAAPEPVGETGSASAGMNKPDVAENGRVRHDPGIKGAEEGLNHGIDDWDDLVSQVIITRID